MLLSAQINSAINMTTEKIKIEVWSDITCPFCYLGKKKLEKAISELKGEDNIEIIYRSFMLDPNFPKNTSMTSLQYLSKHKNIPLEAMQQMVNQLKLQGNNYDINFEFGKSLTFNTFDTHRLIQWAKNYNLSAELKQALLTAYFTDGIDLSKDTNLLKVTETVGLNIEEAKAVLHSDKYSNEVINDIQKAQNIGIRGVPFFLINDKEAISGAQDDTVFKNVLSSALNNLTPIPEEKETGFCEPDKACK